jgi:hypothetical protein
MPDVIWCMQHVLLFASNEMPESIVYFFAIQVELCFTSYFECPFEISYVDYILTVFSVSDVLSTFVSWRRVWPNRSWWRNLLANWAGFCWVVVVVCFVGHVGSMTMKYVFVFTENSCFVMLVQDDRLWRSE